MNRFLNRRPQQSLPTFRQNQKQELYQTSYTRNPHFSYNPRKRPECSILKRPLSYERSQEWKDGKFVSFQNTTNTTRTTKSRDGFSRSKYSTSRASKELHPIAIRRSSREERNSTRRSTRIPKDFAVPSSTLLRSKMQY